MIKYIVIKSRNKVIRIIYTCIFKPIFFCIDPENVHDRMIYMGNKFGKFLITQKITKLLFSYSDRRLKQNILGISFSNPVGLAGGFDKDAQLTSIIPSVGFGFQEIGSITGEPCDGNLKPRLWRLKKSKSILVYYGLKNKGCEVISNELKDKKFKIPIGVNIAKTNCKETVNVHAGIADYVKAYKHMADIGDYVTINISCPNAFGGEPFTDPYRLNKLLTAIDSIKDDKPIFLKISPDLTYEQLDQIINVVNKHKISGFICCNLTKNRKNDKILDIDIPDKGGMSGKIEEGLVNKTIRYIYKKTDGQYVIIGLGGIFSAQDAYEKIRAGASLIQLITGMIYEGPQVISEINLELVKLLKKDGYKNISEAVGVDNGN